MSRKTHAFLFALALWSPAIYVWPTAADDRPITGSYANGELIKLEVDGRNAFLIKPTKTVDPQKRWVWTAPFWLALGNDKGKVEHEFYVGRFLDAGFHVAGVDVGTSCGSPAGAEVYQHYYELLTSKHGLNARARLLGQSNGGLISFAWAVRHPKSVDRIGCIYPAIDFRSWPKLENVVKYPEPKLGFGLTLEELTARQAELNPIDNLKPLAEAGVKVFCLHGNSDTLVPLDANSARAAEILKGAGGEVQVEVLKGLGHGNPLFYSSETLAKFLTE